MGSPREGERVLRGCDGLGWEEKSWGKRLSAPTRVASHTPRERKGRRGEEFNSRFWRREPEGGIVRSGGGGGAPPSIIT